MAENQNNLRNIQWYPGHMTKTKRMISANLKDVHLVAEVVDARIPISSRNPQIDTLCKNKPRLILLNKCDMADTSATDKWVSYFKSKGFAVITMDCKSGRGVRNFVPAVNELMSDYIEKCRARGMSGYQLRVMVVGVPNVGKSSFINKIAGGKRAKVEDRPGVTRGKQWIKIDEHLELLDMPGILWPKFEDVTVGEHLAFTGAIKDDTMDLEYIASQFLWLMKEKYPDLLFERYKVTKEALNECSMGYDVLTLVGAKRGMLVRGGEVNTERAAIAVLDEYRAGKIGRLTLEYPEDMVNG